MALSGWRANLAALAVGGTVSVLLAEAALQIYNPIPLPVRGQRLILAANTREIRRPPFENPKYDREIPVSTNALGFRGPDLPPDPERWLKILTIGGSTTECHYTADDRTWSARLHARLVEARPEVWLNNAGLDGNSTFGHLVLLDQVVAGLSPDVLLFLIGVNDVSRDDQNDYDANTRRAVRDMIIEKSELLSTLQVFWRSFRARDRGLSPPPEFDLANLPRVEITEPQIERILEEHRRRFLDPYAARVRRLIERARAIGAEPVLVTQPSLYGRFTDPTTGVEVRSLQVAGDWSPETAGDNADARERILALYNEVTRKTAAERGVFLIDLAAEMPKDSALYLDWIHFSNAGNEKVAEIVARALLPHLAGIKPKSAR